MVKFESSTKRSLNLRCPNGIRGETELKFLFSHFFSVPQKDEAPQRRVKIKIISFFIAINYFTMLWTGRVFSPKIFINIRKMVRCKLLLQMYLLNIIQLVL